MRPASFDPKTLRTYLRRHRIADLPALKEAMGTSADLTVFRKLQSLGYLSSYTHRGRFYTLREIARLTTTACGLMSMRRCGSLATARS
jgi:hypothetical protein